jgi:lipopolysaccharide transport system permease protein
MPDQQERLTIKVYTPEPLLRHPAIMIREIWRNVLAGRELAWLLFVRDVKAQYRQTFLGYVWAFLPPLVASFTFIFLQSQGIVQIEGTDIPYAPFVLIGTLLWQVFVDAMASPSKVLVEAKEMLTKINFPRETILMTGLYMVLLNFLIRLILLAGVMFWWGIQPGVGLLLFIPAMAALMLCGFAVGLAVSPVGGLYGDISRAIPIVAGFWMLLTPVVYPARTEGLAGIFSRWNPVSPLITTARESLTGLPFTLLPEFLVIAILSVIVVIAGVIGFHIAMPHLIERMGG